VSRVAPAPERSTAPAAVVQARPRRRSVARVTSAAAVLDQFALPDVDDHPAVVDAARIAADILAPHAAAADPARGVGPTHLDALAKAGLQSTRMPAAEGGTGGTGGIDGLAVGADDVLATIDVPAWRAHDAARTANATPASLGLLRRMLVALAELGEPRGPPGGRRRRARHRPRAATLRREAYALLTEVPMMERVEQRGRPRST